MILIQAPSCGYSTRSSSCEGGAPGDLLSVDRLDLGGLVVGKRGKLALTGALGERRVVLVEEAEEKIQSGLGHVEKVLDACGEAIVGL